MKNKKNNKYGFTLIELLAVIVILAIILVIAVPKVMSVIEDAKKATLESTAKMIATGAEKVKVQNTVLGKAEEITCKSVAKINDLDYEDCDIDFDDNTAKVTIKGSGKFAGLYVCNGTKTEATAQYASCSIPYGDGDTYITKLLAQESKLQNGLVQTYATYTNENNEEITIDTGIRYIGTADTLKNQVYFNCEETDGINEYGSKNYDYESSCEVWRIIGVFEVEDENGDKAQRIKIINIKSTFQASWDSSDSSINNGSGVNQWGPSTYKDVNDVEQSYLGSDLMQLLNGYYIEKNDSKIDLSNKKECKYNNAKGQSGFDLTCDTAETLLSSQNMKPLTSKALAMLDEAVWYTYAAKNQSGGDVEFSYSNTAYLQERGITAKYTGCLNTETAECTKDKVTRNNKWTGLIGLMSLSDITYANGWLYNENITPWSITPFSHPFYAYVVWDSNSSKAFNISANNANGVWPSAYLSPNIQIIGGDGSEGNAYRLAI